MIVTFTFELLEHLQNVHWCKLLFNELAANGSIWVQLTSDLFVLHVIIVSAVCNIVGQKCSCKIYWICYKGAIVSSSNSTYFCSMRRSNWNQDIELLCEALFLMQILWSTLPFAGLLWNAHDLKILFFPCVADFLASSSTYFLLSLACIFWIRRFTVKPLAQTLEITPAIGWHVGLRREFPFHKTSLWSSVRYALPCFRRIEISSFEPNQLKAGYLYTMLFNIVQGLKSCLRSGFVIWSLLTISLAWGAQLK